MDRGWWCLQCGLLAGWHDLGLWIQFEILSVVAVFGGMAWAVVQIVLFVHAPSFVAFTWIMEWCRRGLAKKKKEKKLKKCFAWRRHYLGLSILLEEIVFSYFFCSPWLSPISASLLSRSIDSFCSGLPIPGCLIINHGRQGPCLSLGKREQKANLFVMQENKDNVSFRGKCWAGLLAAPLQHCGSLNSIFFSCDANLLCVWEPLDGFTWIYEF